MVTGISSLRTMSVKILPLASMRNDMAASRRMGVRSGGDGLFALAQQAHRQIVQHEGGGVVWKFDGDRLVLVVGQRKSAAHMGDDPRADQGEFFFQLRPAPAL